MSFDMDWSPDFCLACDRQTDGGVYCSESCRLAEYEKAGSGSEASSPVSQTSGSWPITKTERGLLLSPAYDFGAYMQSSRTPTPTSYQSRPVSTPVVPRAVLTPSASQSSLFSLQSASSVSSTSEQPQLSAEAKAELRGYAASFDQSRYQRRTSN